MKHIFLILILIAARAEGGVSRLEEGLQLIERGSMHDAYVKLESIPAGDADFADAMVELQKMHYRNQDWGKFFAYAQYYRAQFQSSDDSGRMPFRARMISLEVMALAKHCIWGTAGEILNWGILQKNRMNEEEYSELQATREFIRLHNKFPRSDLATEDSGKIPSGVFSSDQAWKLKSKALLDISHPKRLTVRLKSECKE